MLRAVQLDAFGLDVGRALRGAGEEDETLGGDATLEQLVAHLGAHEALAQFDARVAPRARHDSLRAALVAVDAALDPPAFLRQHGATAQLLLAVVVAKQGAEVLLASARVVPLGVQPRLQPG